MPLSSDFVHRDLITKHGTKSKPGYELLHPGLHMPRTYRTPKQTETLQRIGALMQAKKKTEAQGLLDKVVNLTPSDRKYVQSQISAIRVTRPRSSVTPSDKATPKTVVSSQNPGGSVEAKDTSMALAIPAGVTHMQAPQGQVEIPDGLTLKQVDAWYAQIKAAKDTDSLTAVEEVVDAAMADHLHTPLWDDLQDAINKRHREHFERDRMSIAKWLSKRGLISKHGNKGKPGYELLHPGSMLPKGNRTPKQEARIERLGMMLQAGDHDGAQALLDRTLNLNDGDRKLVQTQIHAGRSGGTGGVPASDPHPHGPTPQQKAPAPTPKADATPAPKAAEKPVQAPSSSGSAYPQDPKTGDVTATKKPGSTNAALPPPPDPSEFDMTKATEPEKDAFYAGAEVDVNSADNEKDFKEIEAFYKAVPMPATLRGEIDDLLHLRKLELKGQGGVTTLPQYGETNYERPKATISKVERLSKQEHETLFSDKVTTAAEKKAAANRAFRPPSSTPAGQHLASGKGIEDSPGDGLWSAIEADSKRFTITQNSTSSASPTFFVHDNLLNTDHFFKQSLNGGSVEDNWGDTVKLGITGDAVNEITASSLGEAAFPGMFLKSGFAEDPNGVDQPMMHMTHLGEWGKQHGASEVRFDHNHGEYTINQTDYTVQVAPHMQPLADRRQALQIHIFDYLVANSDRHAGNIASMDTKDGRVLIPTDNGGSFHAMISQIDGKIGFDQTLSSVETVPYDVWQTQWSLKMAAMAKGRFMRAETVHAYKGDRAAIKKDAQEIINTFAKVDAAKIAANIRAKYPTLDKYDQTHLDAAITVWQNRIKMINAEDVAKVMT